MDGGESLSHSKWECKYHVVFVPKRRHKTLYAALRKHLGEAFHRLAGQTESRIEEGHLMADHVNMLISIPPKYMLSYAVAQADPVRQREERDPFSARVRGTEAELGGA